MINDSLLVVVLAQAVLYGTPLLYASLGELLAERSGVLNLGVEGMMLFGAAAGYWVTQRVGGSSATVLTLAVLGAAAGPPQRRRSTRSSRSRFAPARSSRASR